MKVNEILKESIEDAGILKAMIIIGIPGAGKSYTLNRIKGVISPKIVNTDIATEFLSNKEQTDIDDSNWFKFEDTARRITKNQLFNYVNGMLPLVVEATSNNPSNILARIGILESLGYDVGMIFINSDIDTALKNIKEREKLIGRKVSKEFFLNTATSVNETKNYFKHKMPTFIEIPSVSELDDEAMTNIYKKTQAFFKNKKIDNPVGSKNIRLLKEKGEKYLTPTILSEEQLQKKIDGWYRN